MKINFLSDKRNSKQYKKLCERVYFVTDQLNKDYPKHKSWFFEKHLPGLGQGREVVYITEHDNVCGVAFLKKTENERKICTFYVAEHCRNKGVGQKLLEVSFDYLETTKPLISTPKYKVQYFLYYMFKYDWKITQILPTFYNDENDEVVFNGFLD